MYLRARSNNKPELGLFPGVYSLSYWQHIDSRHLNYIEDMFVSLHTLFIRRMKPTSACLHVKTSELLS